MAFPGNNRKKKSFFAEQREGNSNPNFFNTMDPSFLRSNVRRIIKDAADDLILDTDYAYFQNQNVLQACIAESYDNMQSQCAISRALEFYRTMGIGRGMVVPYIDISHETAVTAVECAKANKKANIWSAAFNMFKAIEAGYEAKMVLMDLQKFAKPDIRSI